MYMNQSPSGVKHLQAMDTMMMMKDIVPIVCKVARGIPLFFFGHSLEDGQYSQCPVNDINKQTNIVIMWNCRHVLTVMVAILASTSSS